MLYIYFTIFLFLLCYISKNNEKLKNQIYYIVLIALFLFTAYRYQVGCDWYHYYRLFIRFENNDLSETLNLRDPFSMLIFYGINKMKLPYPYIYIPFALIFYLGVHILSRRQQDPLSFLVFLFPILIIHITMSGVRQAAAIGIICIAIVAFIDKRPLRFILFVIIATLFHSSAIIFLILLPFASGKHNNYRLLIAILFGLSSSVLIAFSKDAQFAINAYIGTGREAFGALFRVCALAISGVYFFLFLKNKWKNTFPKDYSIVSLGAFGMILTIFIIPISTIISDRFGYYFIPIQAMIFARLPYLSFKNIHSIHIALPYIGLFLILFIWIKFSWIFQECYQPYKTWIFGLPAGEMF